MDITINAERRLFVIGEKDGFSCLGFNVKPISDCANLG